MDDKSVWTEVTSPLLTVDSRKESISFIDWHSVTISMIKTTRILFNCATLLRWIFFLFSFFLSSRVVDDNTHTFNRRGSLYKQNGTKKLSEKTTKNTFFILIILWCCLCALYLILFSSHSRLYEKRWLPFHIKVQKQKSYFAVEKSIRSIARCNLMIETMSTKIKQCFECFIQ
jgi:hypothetical protein